MQSSENARRPKSRPQRRTRWEILAVSCNPTPSQKNQNQSSQPSTFHAIHYAVCGSRAEPTAPPYALPLLTSNPPHRPCSPPLQPALASRASRELRLEPRERADGARLAELIDVRSVEGTGAVEPEGHGFDVDAQDPGRAGPGAADGGRGGDGRDGDVVLALYFVDGLEITLARVLI